MRSVAARCCRACWCHGCQIVPTGRSAPKTACRSLPDRPAKRLVTRKVPMARAYRPCLWPRRSAFSPLCPHRGSGTFAGYQSRSRGPRARSHGGHAPAGSARRSPPHTVLRPGSRPPPAAHRAKALRPAASMFLPCPRPLRFGPSTLCAVCERYALRRWIRFTQKSGARLKGSARRKGICFICRCNARGGRHAPRPDDPVRNDLRRSHGRDGRSVRWGRRSARP